MTDFVKVGPAKAFPENKPVGIEVQGHPICVVNVGGRFYAVTDRCTHAESLLSPGDVEDSEIVCPLHGARFSLATGEALTLPAVKPVSTHQVKVEGEDVFVKL